MGHSRVRIKVRRRKVAALAAYSRQFTVRNTKKGISPKVEHKLYYRNDDLKDAITCPFTGHKFVPTNPHPIPGMFGITITGYDWVEPKGMLWKPEKHKQPKNLHKKQKEWEKWVHCDPATPEDVTNWIGVKKYPAQKSEYPDYTLPKMNKVEYCEKLVEHKLAKWERKYPQPCPDDDLFKVEYQTQWYKDRDAAKERFRDFVVSIYDPLSLTGRFVVAKENTATYQEEEVAKIKDINGEGHRVNELPKDSKLMKKAQKITNETKQKRPNLIATNLKDHKRQKGRIVLPEAALALHSRNLFAMGFLEGLGGFGSPYAAN